MSKQEQDEFKQELIVTSAKAVGYKIKIGRTPVRYKRNNKYKKYSGEI